MSSSSDDEQARSKETSDRSSVIEEEIIDSPPYVNQEAREYFPSNSESKSSTARSKTPPYTCWKNENIHLFTHELQSDFGRKLQNCNDIMYPAVRSSPPVAIDGRNRKKVSETDVVDRREKQVFHPPPDLRRPRVGPPDNSPRPVICHNRSSSQLVRQLDVSPVDHPSVKHSVSTHRSPCHPPADSHQNHRYDYAQNSHNNDCQSCHCYCSPGRPPRYCSPDRHRDNSRPPRRKDQKEVSLELYRIVLLQNQQLSELQSQVTKLTEAVETLQKEALVDRTAKDDRTSRTSSLGVQTYCEEKLSVGVMTSIVQVPVHPKRNKTEESSSSGETPASTSSSCREEEYQRRKNRRHSKSRKSTGLRSDDIPAVEVRQPSPPASVHVEMPEFDSSSSYGSSYTSSSESDNSDDEKDVNSNGVPQKIGWTYYDAVVGKVNEMLRESANGGGQYDNDTVKRATLDHLISIGVSFAELDLQQSNKRVTFENRQMPVLQRARDETDTSMRLNALAMKYLKDQPHKQNGLKPNAHVQPSSPASNNTNFSFATMRYLERHQLVPGHSVKQPPPLDKTPSRNRASRPRKSPLSSDRQRHEERRMAHSKRKDHRSRKEERYADGVGDQINKILDITAIKNQPKLLPKRF